MCLAIPGRVTRILEEHGEDRIAEIDYDGTFRTAHLLYPPEAGVGDYVLVHAGFATSLVPEEDALEAQRLAREIPPLPPASSPGVPPLPSVRRDGASPT